MDSLAWGQLWNAVEAETKSRRKDLKPGSEEFYETVAKRFTEIIDHTQVVDGILQRSQIMRSTNAVTKMAVSFMGEPTKQYNMLLSAAYDVGHSGSDGGARNKAKKRLARSAMSLLVAGMVNAAAASIIDALRDDDKEKKYWERWLSAMIGLGGDEEGAKEIASALMGGNAANVVNPASYIPFVKDVWSVIQGYDVTRMDMESIDKVVSAAQNFTKALTGTGKYTIASASADLFAEVSRLYGLPVANVKRDVLAAAQMMVNASGNYVWQYHFEKSLRNMNYAANKKAFLNILYNAYVNDREAYDIIYSDMIREDLLKTEKTSTADYIKSGMDDRMKKTQGVDSVSDLENRYLAPKQQTDYDRTVATMQGSGVWSKASREQQDDALDLLYDLVTGSESSAAKSAREKIAGGADVGLSEEEYLLYKLALMQTDEPTESGKLGSYTNDEVEAAIRMLDDLTNAERDYLWAAQGKNEKSTPKW